MEIDKDFSQEQLEEELGKYSDRVSGESIEEAEKTAEKFKNDCRISHLWERIQMMFEIAKNPKTWGYKPALLLGAALIYLVSPFDLIPDITPIVGLYDDIAVIMASLKAAGDGVRNMFANNPYLIKVFPEKLHPIVKKCFNLEA